MTGIVMWSIILGAKLAQPQSLPSAPLGLSTPNWDIIAVAMSATAEKARAQRLQRLESTLAKRLDNPAAVLDVLISELAAGELQASLWEQLHAAATRDGMEEELGRTYVKAAGGRRLQQLEPRAQAEVLMHAADFYQGVLGDADSAENFLERVLYIVPSHAEAFARLKPRFEALGDPLRLVEFYSLVAAEPNFPRDLASKLLNVIVQMPAKSALSSDACKRLVALAPTHPSLLDALEAHCRKTNRIGLACELMEKAIEDLSFPRPLAIKQRSRLVGLYLGEANAPAKAISHVEELLNHNPADETARDAAQTLLSTREVASRAAAALQKARRQARSGE
jgi:tetratricopeptide (TPR) repeat protein